MIDTLSSVYQKLDGSLIIPIDDVPVLTASSDPRFRYRDVLNSRPESCLDASENGATEGWWLLARGGEEE